MNATMSMRFIPVFGKKALEWLKKMNWSKYLSFFGKSQFFLLNHRKLMVLFMAAKDFTLYKDCPVTKITASFAAVTLLYCASPVNIIPDWLPFGGMDDQFLLDSCWKHCKQNLKNYSIWKFRKGVNSLEKDALSELDQ